MLKVTATDLPRLLTCNGSRMLEGNPSFNSDDTVREEGNAADWLIQVVVAGQHTPDELVDRKAPNGVYITAEMVENLTEYLSWVCGKGHIEVNCSHAGRTWEVRGRADHVWYDERTGVLYVSDFKYGWKIVDVEENWTLISHACGWMLQTGITPRHVQFRIYQPRPYHPDGAIRAYGFDAVTLLSRYKQMCDILDAPNDLLNTSKHCYRCPAMATCRAAQIAGMNAIDVSTRAFKSNPTNEQIEFLIVETEKAMSVLKQNLSAYEDLALHRLKNGEVFQNYVIQNDLGRETWSNDVSWELVELVSGVDVTKREMITPKQAIKAGVPVELVKRLTTRPNKGVKLVRRSADEHAKKFLNQKIGEKNGY